MRRYAEVLDDIKTECETAGGPVEKVVMPREGPNATLCGRAGMKLGAHLGPNAVVTDGIQMGRLSILAAGSMLARDSEEGGTYLGVPARLVRTMRNRLER